MLEAVREVFPEAKYQHCAAHFYRNIFSVVPRSKVKLVAKMLKAIHAQESKKAAREKAKTVVAELYTINAIIDLAVEMGRSGDLFKIILSSVKSASMVLFIIAAASSFSWLFTYSNLSTAMVKAITAMHMSLILFCVMIAILLLLFGTFLEGTAICVLLVPVLWPVAEAMGLTAIQFGLIVCLAGVIGAMTPPVAVNIFAACSISKLSIGQVTRGEMPFFLGFVGVLILVALFPALFTLVLN